MALPNYAPTGTILFGSVPWDNSYTGVRLYTSLDQQYNDISQHMTLSSDGYTYIGRNRRIKVDIEADRLYRCNYCMYRNNSLTDGYIYCFITDVRYINDSTSEIAIETDVFQTYLYGIDWTIPACFIERETVPAETERYLLTNEPDFPLIYTVDDVVHEWFDCAGYIIMTSAKPEENQSVVDAVMNPNGYYAAPAPIRVFKDIPNGCNFYWCPSGGAAVSEALESFLNRLTWAGSIESVVAVFSIPTFMYDQIEGSIADGFLSTGSTMDSWTHYDRTFQAPERGASVDGYTPRNAKLLYYPYNFCRLTDYNGSMSDLRYELMGSTRNISIKGIISPACQAVVFPQNYQGVAGLDAGITVACGAQGSWSNSMYSTWLAQNSGMIALTAAGIALAGVSGASSLAGSSRLLSEANTLRNAGFTGFAGIAEADAAALGASAMKSLGAGAAAAGLGYQTLTSASKQPTVTRGQTNYNVTYGSGLQGVHAERVCVKAEVAEQIDQFFDRWGYAVERIEAVNITSRPSWNYIKTGGAAPRSSNAGAGSTAPFSRGRGTPAAALDIIRRAFDGGTTFWHTTESYGDYSLANGV